MCGAVPFNSAVVNDSAVFAEEEAEYTKGTYGVLTYRNYGDYIEISDCDTSATEVEIPSGIDGVSVTSIGDWAFSDCDVMTTITIPDSVASIGDMAFTDCGAMATITIPDSVTSIGASAFFSCTSLTSITIPDSVTSIGDYAFYACYALTSITIPDSVTGIGKAAFYYCEALTSITIPDSVISIGDSAFWGCSALTSITIKNPNCMIADSSNTISDAYGRFTGTIYGYDNSTAQAYAEKYGYKFESLGEYVETILGDIDGDGVINSSDASNVLTAYALIATGGDSPFTDEQMKAADVNNDGAVDSSDASSILAYYAYTATGGTGTLEEFLG
ncbi:MAG: hypothetical protein E7497_00935 [Ruminococcus sp.]|nr:hypothetical protein [Ruminococcus sp.]